MAEVKLDICFVLQVLFFVMRVARYLLFIAIWGPSGGLRVCISTSGVGLMFDDHCGDECKCPVADEEPDDEVVDLADAVQ